MNYSGLSAIITGASSGIGEELARQLHALGANVILCARRSEKLRQTCDVLNSIRKDSASLICADLSNESDCGKIENFIRSNKIDILINNAGRGSFGYYEKINIQDEMNMVRLNIEATMRLAHAAIPQMKQRRAGYILSVSSIAAFQPLPFMATYAATKGFNLMHTLALREELKPFNINVTTLCPGPTATEFGGVARVPGSFSDIHRDSTRLVVSEALRALSNNRSFIVPGVRSWWLSIASRLSPRIINMWITANVMRSIINKVR